MSVICGIDFSEPSQKAADVAAGIAERLAVPLCLVHAVGDWPAFLDEATRTGLLKGAREAVEAEAERFRRRGIELQVRVELDSPEVALLRVAKEQRARLLVFGATGRGGAGGQALGRTADRLAQKSHVPTLVVRDVEPFRRWLRADKPLRVVVGLERDAISEDAWRWAEALESIGPVERMGVHIYWPPREFHRLGLGGVRSYVDVDPDVESTLRREFESRFQTRRDAKTQLHFRPGIGRAADHLLAVANELKADLVVVGSHQRSAVGRLWEGSISHGVLRYVQGSVACVPLVATRARHLDVEARVAMAATDFSQTGNGAIAHAFANAGRDGKVYLVHVLPSPTVHPSPLEPSDIFAVSTDSQAAKRAAEEKLRSLIPRGADASSPTTELVVLQARAPGDAIAQAAERLNVGMICLGTRGRHGLSKALLGSVAEEVLAKTQRPVLLVRPPKE